MKIFLSYGHDSNAPLVEKIKEYLSVDADGKHLHDVWIDTSEIKAGQNWRRRITDGIIHSDIVLAGLSKHSIKTPGVCRDELNISIGVKGGNIKTILLEPTDEVSPPAIISHIQWLDMSDWKEHYDGSFDAPYFREYFAKIREIVDNPENNEFEGEITKLRNYFTPISSIGRINNLLSDNFYGRDWIINELLEWDRKSEQRIFWIMAGPGFGKSTFAANLQLQYNSKIPAIHFVEWGKPHQSDPGAILRNLAFQLAVRYPEYRKIILALPDDTLGSLKNISEDDLFQILFCDNSWYVVDGERENVWILMDALDEASNANGNKIAETLARHIEQLPSWMRFIITSRHDPMIQHALSHFKPQILDIEAKSIAYNLEDMRLYLNTELQGCNIEEDVKTELLQRSDGVFLYLRLCVDALKNGELSLCDSTLLPNSLSDYYYLAFVRLFGRRLEYYRKLIVPMIEVIVGAEESVSIPFIKLCSEIENEYDFHDALRDVKLICRFDQHNGTTYKTISFFHQSVKDWLLDPDKSEQFYISENYAKNRIYRNFMRWLISDSRNDSAYWSINGFGIQNYMNVDLTDIGTINQSKLILLIDSIHINSTFGAMLKTRNYEVNVLLSYIDEKAKSKDNVSVAIQFINVLFEAIKDKYIEAGFVSNETRYFSDDYKMMESIGGGNVFKAIKAGVILGIIGHHVSENAKSFQKSFRKELKKKMEIISYYDYRIAEVMWGRGSLNDLADFASREMNLVIEKL